MQKPVSWLAVLVLLGVLGLGARDVFADAQGAGDKTIISEVQEKLFEDSSLENLDINVESQGGVVRLSGSVNTNLERAAAERIASREKGVKRVVNILRVSRGGQASAGSPHPSAARHVTIPSGTIVTVRMIDSIDSKVSRSGQEFAATVDSAVVAATA